MVGTTTSPIAAYVRERAAPRADNRTAPREGYRAAPRAGYRNAPRADYRTAPQQSPDARPANGIPSWKRRIFDALASELERRGASRGSRVREGLTGANVDARIANLTRELRARARDRTGYEPQGAANVGVVVNRTV